MSKPLKIGPKGRHLHVPPGWELVTEGRVQEGDKFANLYTLQWQLVELDDLGDPVEWFDYLIRKEERQHA